MSLTTEQIAACIEQACTDEVMAPKAGNVHPGAAFHDTAWRDFVDSARITAPLLARAHETGVGEAVLQAVRATREKLGMNTNLGIVLLIAPMAAAAAAVKPADAERVKAQFRKRIVAVLSSLSQEDSRKVYMAISLANPGGLGKADEADVLRESASKEVTPISKAMALAQDRDLIARQYAGNFADVFDKAAAWIREELPKFNNDRLLAVVSAHVRLMAALPDTLIQRKLGIEAMRTAARKAQVVQESGGLLTAPGRKAFAELDLWLRGDGNKRNPGATADLIAAGLFAIEIEDRLAAIANTSA